MRGDKHGGLVSHAVYCRRMEQRLREAWAAGMTGVHVAPLRATDFARWVADNGASERDATQLLARYAADLGQDLSQVVAWSPGCNELCWCGLGRKYKKCCDTPGPGGAR